MWQIFAMSINQNYIHCRAVGTRGRQILARIRENPPDFNGLRLGSKYSPLTPPGFLDRPTALHRFICLGQCVLFWCHIFDVYVCTRIVIHTCKIHPGLFITTVQIQNGTLVSYNFIFFYAHFGLKNNNNLMDRSHFETQNLTTAHSSGCPWNFLNYLCMSPVVTS